MHKIATARPVPAAFGVFWNYRGRVVPCEAYTMGADGCPTSGDGAAAQELADAYYRGATFLTYEASLTQEAAQARAVECGPNYSALPLPAGWYFYDGEQLCVVAPAITLKDALNTPLGQPAKAKADPTVLTVKRGNGLKVIEALIRAASHESTSLAEKLEAHKRFLAAQLDHMSSKQ